MAAPSSAELEAFVRGALVDADLDRLTAKDVRTQAEAHFGVRLKAQKDVIKASIQTFIENLDAVKEEGDEEEEAEGSEEEAEVTPTRGRGLQKEVLLSEGLATLLGVEDGRLPRTQVTKRMWAYIKEHALQDPKDGRKILMDEPMRELFKAKTATIFSINKHLSKHLYADDASLTLVHGEAAPSEEEDGYGKEEDPPPRKQAKAKATKKRKRAAGETGQARGGLSAPMEISPSLQRLVGEAVLSRAEISSQLWSYIKEHDLQDPNDKRQILWDETAQDVFRIESCSMFKMAKLIKAHVRPIGDATPFGDPEELAQLVRDEMADPAPRKSPAKKTKRAVKGEGGGGGGGGGGPLYELSDALAGLTGERQMRRPAITKSLWEYIREHDLQNPDNRREIFCDATLEEIFGESKVTMFSMNKFVGRALTKI